MKIFCMPSLFSASCIRLFDRLSDIGVFGHYQMSPIDRILKNDASKSELFEDVFVAGDIRYNRSNEALAALEPATTCVGIKLFL